MTERHREIQAQQDEYPERNKNVVQTAPGNRLQQHDDKRDVETDEQSFDAPRIRKDDQCDIDAEEGNAKKCDGAFHALGGARRRVSVFSVLSPSQRGNGVRQGKDDQRNGVQQFAATCEVIEQRNR